MAKSYVPEGLRKQREHIRATFGALLECPNCLLPIAGADFWDVDEGLGDDERMPVEEQLASVVRDAEGESTIYCCPNCDAYLRHSVPLIALGPAYHWSLLPYQVGVTEGRRLTLDELLHLEEEAIRVKRKAVERERRGGAAR